MVKLLAKWLIMALALLAAAYLIDGVDVSGPYIALITAVIIGLLNVIARPLLLVITLPINILTLGLFTFVINALIFWFVSSFVQGFDVGSFWYAFVGAFVVTVVSYVGDMLIEAIQESDKQS